MGEMPTMVCWTCKEEKPLDQFGRNKWRPSGFHGRCLACSRLCDEERRSKSDVKARIKQAASTPQAREKEKIRKARYLERHPPDREKEKIRKARYLEQHPHIQRKYLIERFGLTYDLYQAMLEEQGGVCAICRMPETITRSGTPIHLAIDHDHSTGKVRGLLCRKCNLALGFLEKNVGFVEAAMQYKEFHRQLEYENSL